MENNYSKKIDSYTIQQFISEGYSAKVYIASNQAQNCFAIKIFDDSYSQYQEEIKIMQDINHPSLIRLIDWGHKYIVMDLFGEGDLFDAIQQNQAPFQISQAFNIFNQLLEAVEYLHQLKIVHRDIKLENILYSHGQIKLCDFGLSSYVDNISVDEKKLVGTRPFMAPERYLLQNQYWCESDVFSLGVVFFCMIFKSYPFSDTKKCCQYFNKIANGKWKMYWSIIYKKTGIQIDEKTKKILEGMLQVNPENRMKIEEIKNILT